MPCTRAMNGTNLRISRDLAERRLECANHVKRQRIETVRLIEAEPGDGSFPPGGHERPAGDVGDLHGH